MRAKILKMAGCKTEAEFYKKYPTEAAFKKKFGSEFEQLLKDYKNVKGPKKAEDGITAGLNRTQESALKDFYDYDKPVPGGTGTKLGNYIPTDPTKGVANEMREQFTQDKLRQQEQQELDAAKNKTKLIYSNTPIVDPKLLKAREFKEMRIQKEMADRQARREQLALDAKLGRENQTEANKRNQSTYKGGGKIRKAQTGLKTGDNNNNGIPDYLENQAGPSTEPKNQFSFPQQFPPSIAGKATDPFAPKKVDNLSPKTYNTAGQKWAEANPVPSEIKQDAQTAFDMNKRIDEQAKADQTRIMEEGKKKVDNTPKGIGPGMKLISNVVKGIKMLRAEREAKRSAKMWAQVSEVSKQASQTTDVNRLADIHDQAVRQEKAMKRSIVGEELYPVEGVGTVVRNGGIMQSGGEIQNTYAPNTLYNDLGYAPLNDPNKMKAFYSGGKIPKAQYGELIGAFMQMFSKGGGSGAASGAGAAANAAGSSGGSGIGNFFSKWASASEGGAGNASMTGAGSGGVGTEGIGGGMLGGSGGGAASGAGGAAKGMGGGGGNPYGAVISQAGEVASADIAKAYDNNAGSYLGGLAGKELKKVYPILGTAVEIAGTALGGALDTNVKKMKQYNKQRERNEDAMAYQAQTQSLIGGLQDRGIATHGANINPQVIKKFGKMSMADQLKWFYTDMNTLRSGGSIRDNEYQEIEAEAGGNVNPVSYNPISGERSFDITGQSHEESNGQNSGVILNKGGVRVEAEGGEAVADGDESTIFGNQTLHKEGAKYYGLEGYAGMKIKNIYKEFIEKEKKLNKEQEKNTLELAEFDPETPHDKLKFNSLTMKQIGIQKQFEGLAAKTGAIKEYQQRYNLLGKLLDADAGELTRGVYKKADPRAARNGAIIPIAQSGITEKPGTKKRSFKSKGVGKDKLPSSPIGYHEGDEYWGNEAGYEAKWKPRVYGSFTDPARATNIINYLDNYTGEGAEALKANLAKYPNADQKLDFLIKQATNKEIGPIHEAVRSAIDATEPINKPAPGSPPADKKDDNYAVTPYKRSGLIDALGAINQMIKPDITEPLQGDQLAGEYYALSNARTAPVDARFKQSLLDVPYDISFQDQLNENTASFRTLARQVGNNPEALSALAGQKYMADSKILAEQFRANQAKKDEVYSGNREVLNQDQEYNLRAMDQQYVRQQQAASNTRRDIFDSLSSMADKYGKNRLENRTLQVYANMFPDFSYGKDYSIMKTGAPHQWNVDQIYMTEDGKKVTQIPVIDANGNTIRYQQVEVDKTPIAKNETSAPNHPAGTDPTPTNPASAATQPVQNYNAPAPAPAITPSTTPAFMTPSTKFQPAQGIDPKLAERIMLGMSKNGSIVKAFKKI